VLRYSPILLPAIALASAGWLSAQEVTKPGPAPIERLPKPAAVTAAQQPDRRIRVVWRAVEGAVRYKMVRSVPPDPSRLVSLPNPADTQYVDADVKPGSTYYYLVSAVNEAGTEGLKAGSAPVTAAAAPVETTPTLAPVPPPTNVVAKMFDYRRPMVTWRTTVPGARAIIERREEINTTDVPWQTAVTLVDQSWPCSAECRWIDDPRPFKGTSVSYYRLTIVEPAPSTRKSEPVTTNSVYVGEIVTAPTEMHVEWMAPGETKQLSNKADAGAQYLALDSNTVSVPLPGVIKAKQQGRAYVTAVSRSPEQVLKLWIWEIQVSDKPQ
jgi:hypothetical protein